MSYKVAEDGKWSQPHIWEQAVPGKQILKGDTAIIDQFITLNTDIELEGVLIIESQGSLLGNKSIQISSDAILINKGSVVVKEILNNGVITNHLVLECTRDLINKGQIINYETVLVGSQIQNLGAIQGDGGQYFTSDEIVNTSEGVMEGNIDVCAAKNMSNYGSLDSSAISMCGYHMVHSISLIAVANEDKIDLNLINPEDRQISHVRIERSTNGKQFTLADIIGGESIESGNQLNYLYGDEFLFDETFIYYRVVVVDTEGKISELPTVGVSKPRRKSSEFASAE